MPAERLWVRNARRIAHRFTSALIAGALVACCTLTGCSSNTQEEAIAATVNGQTILESEVTAYIEGFRALNTAYEPNDNWANYLTSAGFTAKSLREYLLNEKFIPELLIRQSCEQLNISVAAETLDAIIEDTQAVYSDHYGDSWASVLSAYGYDESSWRDAQELELLREQLKYQVFTEEQYERWDEETLDTKFENWLAKITKQSEIEITAMPEGLSYDVDASL